MALPDETPVQRQDEAPGSPEAGPWIGNLNQSDFDLEFYERVLSRQPNDVRLLRLLGELHARRGQYERALEIDQRLVALAPDDSVAHYNLACSLALRGAAYEALDSLGRAIELGYNDFSHLEDDPDLSSLRQLPQYQALLKQYGLNG